jgi:radical SAM protein with 4Fe4S-binding SPASM domain
VSALFNDSLNFLLKLNFRKIQNAFLNRHSFFISRIIGRPVIWGYPVSASIEATTFCNLQCPECPSGLKKFTRPTGSIIPEKFLNYITPLSKRLTYLMIYFQGEPYMNKNFFDLIKISGAKKIYTATSTNGHFLNDENAEQTVRSGLDRLIISLDGTDQETYSSYRKNGNFDTVINGIKNTVEWKKKLKSKKPYIILQFLVLKTNESKIGEIRRLAKDLGVNELQLKTAQFYEFENGNPLMPENRKFSRYKKNLKGIYSLKKKTKNRCLRMWQSLVIIWDGKIVPCCFDKDADFILGDLNKNTFPEIWKGNTYKEFREKILHQRKDIPICCNCTE